MSTSDENFHHFDADEPLPGAKRGRDKRGDGGGARKKADGNGPDLNAGATTRQRGKSSFMRPVIWVSGEVFRETAEAAEQAIMVADLPLFSRSQQLVRPMVEEVDGACLDTVTGKRARTATAALVPVSLPIMRQFMGQAARFERALPRGGTALVKPPKDIAELILSRSGFWPFDSIAGVMTTPTLRPDGSILATEGYDPVTRLYLLGLRAMPALPTQPTRQDAMAALALLKDLLSEVPFVDDASLAVALSAIVTSVVRGAMATAPMHVFSAPESGTGKSYLADIVSAVANGTACPCQAIGRDEAETEKRLGAALIKGHPLLNLDNINGRLGGDFLCQLIERTLLDVRPLGASISLRLEPRLTLLATGNNIAPSGDVVRRCILARLDARLEDPTEREFTKQPVNMVMRDRGRYIAAALTICRAYFVASQPALCRPLASFEQWSAMVRSALVWLGCADPCTTTAAIRVDDSERQAQREAYAAIAARFGTQEWRVADVTKAADTAIDSELNQALLAVAASRNGLQIDATKFGNWLRQHRDAVVDDLRLTRCGQTDKKTRWRLDRLR